MTINEQIAGLEQELAKLRQIQQTAQQQAEREAAQTERAKRQREQADQAAAARADCEQTFMAQFEGTPATISAANLAHNTEVAAVERLIAELAAAVDRLTGTSGPYLKAIQEFNQAFHRHDWRPIANDQAALRALYARLFGQLFGTWAPATITAWPAAPKPPYKTTADRELANKVNLGLIIDRLAALPSARMAYIAQHGQPPKPGAQ